MRLSQHKAKQQKSSYHTPSRDFFRSLDHSFTAPFVSGGMVQEEHKIVKPETTNLHCNNPWTQNAYSEPSARLSGNSLCTCSPSSPPFFLFLLFRQNVCFSFTLKKATWVELGLFGLHFKATAHH